MPDTAARTTVLITGASRGIGLAMVEAFLRAGANVIAVARDTAALSGKALHDGQVLRLIDADLGSAGASAGIAARLQQQRLTLDCLINNAGTARFQALQDVEDSAIWQQLTLNVVAPLCLTRDLLPLLNARASIINVSSYFARRMLQDRPSSAYSASKGALEALTRALAFELGPRSIRVNAIAPGSVQTPLLASNLQSLTSMQREAFLAKVPELYPLGRLGTPQDVADAAVFLASPQASWITGATLAVDGGLTTH